MNQNWFATLALLSWPIVTLWLYKSRPVGLATIWTIIGAQLLLPEGAAIKFQGVPAFDKMSIPNVAALIGCILVTRRALRFWNGFGLPEVLLFMSLVSPFVTAELNTDTIYIANRVLTAETNYDALSAIVRQFIFLLPFFIGRQLLKSTAGNLEILHVLVIAGLLYSFPILFELRMGPQLSQLIYGYQASNISQFFRDGGYRPAVFMVHPLTLSLFIMTSTVAAATFWRTQIRVTRLAPTVITAYLSGILLLCKSLGAILYGATLLPLVRWTKPRFQLRVALVLVAISLLYPALRFTNIFPTNFLYETAELISQERALSLKTRFDQEQQLLDRATQRFMFGWGRWGRSRLYDANSGEDISITDGGWIVVLGSWGLFGFVAQFGLITIPVVRAASALRYAKSEDNKVFLAALALILAISVVDLLPNSSLSPWTLLLAGALLGRTEALRATAREFYNPVVRTNSTSGSNAKPRQQAGGPAFEKWDSESNKFQ
jgi:hypothetical protein